MVKLTKVVFPGGKIHYLAIRRSLFTLCGIYRRSTLQETLKEATCKHCIRLQKQLR